MKYGRAFFFFCLSAWVCADKLTVDLSQLLQAPLERGQFEQIKTVAGLPLPLRAKGRFELTGLQLNWRTLEPFDSELRFTPTAIEQWQGEQKVWQITRAEQPVVAVLSDLMRALVQADVAVLKNYFEVLGFDRKDNCWQLDLVSRDASLSSAIKQIRVEGCEQVNQLHLLEQNGSETTITLTGDH